MSDETTTEQLAEIEGQAEPQPEPIQVREGRWRTRHGAIRNVTPTPADDSRATRWPWRDAKYDQTWREDGGCHIIGESPSDLVEYLGPIEQQPQPEPVPEPDAELRIRLLKQANDSQAETIGRLLTEARDLNMEIGGLERRLSERDARIRDLETMHAAATQAVVDAGKENDKLRTQAEELRSEVSYVQRLLDESRQRVTQLEELVASLRTINEGAEKAVEAAGKENTALRNQLAAVKAELASVAADRQRLRVELDAAQQVPADSPELRQLRADLAEVIRDRDTYRDGYDRVLSDLRTIRETAKAEAVEAIVEWLVPIRTCGSQALATAVISNLPHIMRSLTGLEDEGIE